MKPAQTPVTPDNVWVRLDVFLARLRPHREPLSVAVDMTVVALCWNATYLFRLGFERWISARPSYDGWVLLGVVLAYGAASVAFKVPQSMWRFSGFGEIKRLMLACAVAGAACATVVMGLGLTKVPRAVRRDIPPRPWPPLVSPSQTRPFFGACVDFFFTRVFI